jgi:catechol 2,3-dioxygenase-like lactoylglutathione lyase family enzyme
MPDQPAPATPPPPPELGRFVLCLDVADLSASRDFYLRLGLQETGGDLEQGYCFLRRGDLELHLFQGHIEGNVLNFRDADVFAAAKGLEARGLVLEVGAHVESDGTHGAWLRDPDGNPIYLNT